MASPSIGIVGAGVMGLSAGINILRDVPGARVTLYADRFDKDTTSYGAGGLFRPNADHLHGVDPDTVIRWSVDGFKYFSQLATSPEARDSGQQVMPGYVFSNTPILDPLYKEVVFSFKELSPVELKKLGVTYKYGYQVTTIITDCSRFVPWLMKKYKERGGNVIKRTIKSLEEFVGVHDVVLNCSGLRSRDLVGDTSVYPIKGHLLKIKAPWIKYWVYTEDSAYFVPGHDWVCIGGIREKDSFDTTAYPKDAEGIKERCYKLWPALRGAPVFDEWVDLRPHRDPPRLERETMKFDKGELQVVHNYGHGALGITLCHGTSGDASRLAIQALQERAAKL